MEVHMQAADSGESMSRCGKSKAVDNARVRAFFFAHRTPTGEEQHVSLRWNATIGTEYGTDPGKPRAA